jgi:hypothetical protein
MRTHADFDDCETELADIDWKLIRRIAKRAAKEHDLDNATLDHITLRCRDGQYRWAVRHKEGAPNEAGDSDTSSFDEEGELVER